MVAGVKGVAVAEHGPRTGLEGDEGEKLEPVGGFDTPADLQAITRP